MKPSAEINLKIATDQLENMIFAMEMHLPADVHLEALKKTMPKLLQILQEVYVEQTGENPWCQYEHESYEN